jgi:hypothetical protein
VPTLCTVVMRVAADRDRVEAFGGSAVALSVVGAVAGR